MAENEQISETIKVTMDKRLVEIESSVTDFVEMCINEYIESNPHWIAEQLELDPREDDLLLDEITSFTLERVDDND